ncbi:CBASS cGAMP-activated phospholipase [Moraxella sp. CTOTU49803]|uniref:CBASS cGAMP-activated phospholipase n=1 Tax=Moraxella sp. CTOTU49803 TaxID=2953840 RepID=UPI0001B39E08|nr:CBASS cGAMP-activated phospholipase [Moraxella sp. CTOTU49803]EEV23307.1 phospholipase, patatin family [Enhydrobacter aerosaccus SK60]
MNNRFNILSLPGGGYRGLYTARIMADFEDQFGKPIGQSFDLIAGTSIGGILALAAAYEVPMSTVVELFQDHGKKIFEKQRFNFFGIRKASYSNEHLKSQLIEFFGDSKIGDLKHNVIIPSINFSAGKPVVFKTPHHESFVRDHKCRIVDVALATSAAPTFFPKYNFDNSNFVDGGLFANNPGILAIHEAQHFFNIPKDDIYLLNIGTLSSNLSDVAKKEQKGGMLDWANGLALHKAPKNIIELTLSTQQEMLTHMTRHVLGNRYFSIDANLSKSSSDYIGLDRCDDKAISVLISNAQQCSKEALGNADIRELLSHNATTPNWVK